MLASLGAVSVNTWYEVDVTSLVTGDGTYSLRISSTSTNGADYSSKEGTNPPELVLTLGGTPAPTNTPTPGPSPTPTKTPTPSATPVATNTPTPAAFSSAAFVYDGDGKRVKSTFNGTVTTYFVGAHYEVANGVVTKYYYAGAQRIAMRTNGTLNFLIGDHLGSTSLTTSATGTVISELRYKAWGEVRYSSGTTATKYQYTGQYSYASDFGLMFYNARWYDSSLGRFAQADTIIPGGVQGYDRYAYVNNAPMNYTDPSGHYVPCEADAGECHHNGSGGSSSSSLDSQYGISFTGEWGEGNQNIVRTAVRDVAKALLRDYKRECRWVDDCESYSAAELFRAAYNTNTINPLVFQWGSCSECNGAGGYTYGSHHIAFASLAKSYPDGVKTPPMAFREGVNNVVHELGHAFASLWSLKGGGYDNSGPYGTGQIPGGLVNNNGFYLYPDPAGARLTWRQHPCTTEDGCSHEVFADMFLGWTYGAWASNQAGVDRANFMNQNMAPWIVNLVSP